MNKNDKCPTWTKKLESLSKKDWVKQKESRKSEYIIAIIVNAILFYLFNSLLAWNVPFLTSEWTSPLWILNISLALTILANFVWLFFDPTWFKSLLKAGLNVISIIFMITLYSVFPFDFSSLSYGEILNVAMRLLLIVGIIGTIVAIFVEIVRIVLHEDKS